MQGEKDKANDLPGLSQIYCLWLLSFPFTKNENTVFPSTQWLREVYNTVTMVLLHCLVLCAHACINDCTQYRNTVRNKKFHLCKVCHIYLILEKTKSSTSLLHVNQFASSWQHFGKISGFSFFPTFFLFPLLLLYFNVVQNTILKGKT